MCLESAASRAEGCRSNSDDALATCTNLCLDSDGDGVGDDADNCTLVANPNQRDTDADNIGNACDPDIAPADANDCLVNFLDLLELEAHYFAAGDLHTDFTGDGQTNMLDLSIAKDFFLGPPGPSALGCN